MRQVEARAPPFDRARTTKGRPSDQKLKASTSSSGSGRPTTCTPWASASWVRFGSASRPHAPGPHAPGAAQLTGCGFRGVAVQYRDVDGRQVQPLRDLPVGVRAQECHRRRSLEQRGAGPPLRTEEDGLLRDGFRRRSREEGLRHRRRRQRGGLSGRGALPLPRADGTCGDLACLGQARDAEPCAVPCRADPGPIIGPQHPRRRRTRLPLRPGRRLPPSGHRRLARRTRWCRTRRRCRQPRPRPGPHSGRPRAPGHHPAWRHHQGPRPRHHPPRHQGRRPGHRRDPQRPRHPAHRDGPRQELPPPGPRLPRPQHRGALRALLVPLRDPLLGGGDRGGTHHAVPLRRLPQLVAHRPHPHRHPRPRHLRRLQAPHPRH